MINKKKGNFNGEEMRKCSMQYVTNLGQTEILITVRKRSHNLSYTGRML